MGYGYIVDQNKGDQMTETSKPTFMETLEKFTDVIADLSDAWDREDHTGDFFSAEYPFTESLDEVVHRVIKWRDTQRRQDQLTPITTMLEDAELNDEELGILEEIVQRRRARLQRTAETE